ncbi:MAG: glycine dehydrogenase subunit 2, partial [Bacillota bacterium]
MEMKTKIRDFHQARWDEPIIFDMSTPGEAGIHLPEIEPEIETETNDIDQLIPKELLRSNPPALPEMSQMRVLKHYLHLSQENLGADLNVDIGQGTCTMKYSPNINEKFASS